MLGTSGPGRGAEADAKGKAAATPEEAVRLVLQASRAGNAAGILAQVAEPNRTLLRAQLETLQLFEEFQNLLKDRFGKDPRGRDFPSVKEGLRAVKDLRVLGTKRQGSDKGRVELTIWEVRKLPDGKQRVSKHTWTALRQGTAWKLLLPVEAVKTKKQREKGPDGKEVEVHVDVGEPPPPNPRQVEYARKVLPKYRETMARLFKEVKGGKYKTREQAGAALEDAMRALEKANPRPRSNGEKPKQN
jgi:hypothetical protein